jgi:hypothetical protein
MFESNQFLGNRFLEIKGASKLAGLFSRSQQLDLHFLQKKHIICFTQLKPVLSS